MDTYKKIGSVMLLALAAACSTEPARHELVAKYSSCRTVPVTVTEHDRLEDWLNHEGRPVGQNTAKAIFARYNSPAGLVAGRIAYLPDLNGDGNVKLAGNPVYLDNSLLTDEAEEAEKRRR